MRLHRVESRRREPDQGDGIGIEPARNPGERHRTRLHPHQGTRQLFYGDDGLFKDSVKRMLDHVPLGRPGTVDEIAVAAQFLADPENSYMNGHILTVDGGWTAGYSRDF